MPPPTASYRASWNSIATTGVAMKGKTLLAKCRDMGVTNSFSRPHTSDDNPFSEALFRTMK